MLQDPLSEEEAVTQTTVVVCRREIMIPKIAIDPLVVEGTAEVVMMVGDKQEVADQGTRADRSTFATVVMTHTVPMIDEVVAVVRDDR